MFGTDQGIKQLSQKLEEKSRAQYLLSEEGKKQYVRRKRYEAEKIRDKRFKKMLNIHVKHITPKNAAEARRRVASMFENK